MKTIQLTSHVGNDGILSLRLPEEMKGQNLEILVVLQPIKNTSTHRNAWPPDFFEKTYGATAHDPIERPPQGEFEIREIL
jgi:hypothetical protein